MRYTTVQNDMWDSISYEVYGSCDYTDVLIEANPKYRKVYCFSAGVIIDCPLIAEKESTTLPPWRKVSG
ncbi:MAG: tail protein X [Christensenellales bacterium]